MALPQRHRLRGRRVFDRLYRQGRRINGTLMVLRFLPEIPSLLPPPRRRRTSRGSAPDRLPAHRLPSHQQISHQQTSHQQTSHQQTSHKLTSDHQISTQQTSPQLPLQSLPPHRVDSRGEDQQAVMPLPASPAQSVPGPFPKSQALALSAAAGSSRSAQAAPAPPPRRDSPAVPRSSAGQNNPAGQSSAAGQNSSTGSRRPAGQITPTDRSSPASQGIPGGAASTWRCAVVVSGKVSRRAVRRNRLRRLLHAHLLAHPPRPEAPHWLMLSLRPGAADAEEALLLGECDQLLHRAGLLP